MVCGFDVLGFAVEEPFDIMRIGFSEKPGITIHHIDAFQMPQEPEKKCGRCSFARNAGRIAGFWRRT